jgi:cold-inducible RNA-binding protein
MLLDPAQVRADKASAWDGDPRIQPKGYLVKKIFVGNFSFSTTEADLRQLFEPYGAIDSVTVVTDRDTGRSRGFGFVEMPNDSEAEAAITALNGNADGGRPLTVNEARPKAERSGGGGGRRFGGGGGGGGRGRDDFRGNSRQPREPRW